MDSLQKNYRLQMLVTGYITRIDQLCETDELPFLEDAVKSITLRLQDLVKGIDAEDAT